MEFEIQSHLNIYKLKTGMISAIPSNNNLKSSSGTTSSPSSVTPSMDEKPNVYVIN